MQVKVECWGCNGTGKSTRKAFETKEEISVVCGGCNGKGYYMMEAA